MSFSLLSLNVRGIRCNVKRKALFLFCKEQVKVNCFFLQETHSTDVDVRFWKSQWGGEALFSHGTSHSAGVAFLFKRMDSKIVASSSDNEGHWIMVVLESNECNLILINVYGYTNKAANKLFFQNMATKIDVWKNTYFTDKIIIGGDFNAVPDEWQDRYPTPFTTFSYNPLIYNISQFLDLIDVWRVQNPHKKQFTWGSFSGRIQRSRLDFWLITSNLLSSTFDCNISPSVLTDHSAISLSLRSNDSSTSTRTHWKFNNNLLKCESFCNSILLMINNVKTMSELTSIGKWEWVKFNVKKIAIKEGKQIANARKFRQTTILSRLNFFSNKDILSKSEEKELYTLQSELDDFYTEKAKGAFIRSRARWIEEGEKNSSYFFNLEKQKQALKTINRLSIDNCISQEKTQIDDYIYSFYTDLYKSKFSESDCDLFFSFIKDRVPIIDSDFRNMMDADIEISELDTAIKQMSNGKSPGIDGITVELYKHFWHEIRILVFEALKECIDKAELSPSMKHGLIILAPKSNKDKLFLDNWRPITLLCNDFKLLSHVFANRLKKGIGEIISETQSAFIKGRSIHSHIRLVLDMLDYNFLIPQTSLLLFLDFFKAFDTLEHSFLFRSLETFGFGPMFCKVISMFYNDIFSSVSLNVGSSPKIQIKRGIRQGCPVSPLLFNLAVELMSLFIKNFEDNIGIDILGRTFTISQFADDTLLFLKNKEVLPLVIEKISVFSKASGLTLNFKKCELMAIHNCNLDVIEGIPVKKEIKYLGVMITNNVVNREHSNFNSKIESMKKSLNHWLSRDLSILGRILLTKTEGISKLIYLSQALYTAPRVIKSVNSILFKFIWKNKTHYLRKFHMVKEYEHGGLRAIDFESLLGTFRIKWLKECLIKSHSIWYHIPNHIFKKIGGLDFVLRCDLDPCKIPLKVSNFHKQVLLFWKMMFTHNFSPHNSTLWNNRVVIINRKSLFKSDWYSQGIFFIHDLLDDNGFFLSYIDFISKYKVKITLKGYNKVCNAIPTGLLRTIQSSFSDLLSRPVVSLPSLKICNVDLLDYKCNNKLIYKELKRIITGDYKCYFLGDVETSVRDKAFTRYMAYPVAPKVKETHYKIMFRIYPVSDFIQKRFHFDVDPCGFCSSFPETLDHLFFYCEVSSKFWFDIHSWLSVKMKTVSPITQQDVLFFKCDLNSSFSDVVNFVLLMGKYHIHTCKWKKCKPSFNIFLCEFVKMFQSLKCLKKLNRKSEKLCFSLSKYLLF